MKFINLTRHTEIGANSYYLESGGARLILDCGMHPKEVGENALPNWKAVEGRTIDAILISHAHQDHIGTLPALMRHQPHARFFMTEPTSEIGSLLLHNSVNVMTRQREDLGLTIYPLFGHREIDGSGERWYRGRYRQPYTTARNRIADGGALAFDFWDAGHVLGSSGILLRAEGQTIFYTGDVNLDDQTIMQSAVFPQSDVDILIMECTQGDNPEPAGWSRDSEEKKLADAIEATFSRGGCALIPVAALGKTQEALGMFYEFRRQQQLDFPAYIGGLSSKMTDVYDRRANQTRRQWPRLQLMQDVAPFVLNGQTINDSPARAGRVYALSSGMMTPKTLSNIFARRLVGVSQHSILFVGYADPESPGGILRSAKTGASIALDPDEPSQTLRCHVEQFQFSAHASRESLVAYATKLAPKKVLLVHGDPPAMEWMRAQLSARLPGSEIIVPTPGVTYEL